MTSIIRQDLAIETSNDSADTMLDAALGYVTIGWHVFPAPATGEKMGLYAGAETNGRRWGNTKDAATVRAYWGKHPDANIGLPTGQDNNVFVFEFDTPEGHQVDGAFSLAQLEVKYGKLPPTLQAQSPSGSTHYFFRHPGFYVKSSASEIAPGIDIKGDGGMVLATPSNRPGKGVYRWLNDLHIADAPQWLLDKIKATKSASTVQRPAVPIPPPPPGATPVEKAQHKAYHSVAQTTKGGRNHKLNEASFNLGKFVGAGDLDEETATQLLLAACEANGSLAENARECHGTIDSGLSGGKRESCKVMNSFRDAVAALAPSMGMPVFPVASPPLAPVPPTSDEAAKAAAEALENAREREFPTPPDGFIQSSAQFLAGRKPPDYLIRPIFQRRYCYSITAQTDTGKTSVAMRFAAHVAIGKGIDGNVTVKKGTVLYFVGENPEDVQNRWLGLCNDMGIDPTTTDVHFISGAMHISKVAKRIEAEIVEKGLEPALIIVDTSAAYFETDNESDTMQALAHAKRMRSLCQLPGGPCVLVLCHPTKNAKAEELIPRGGGAFLNEVDGNMALRRSGDMVSGEKLGKFRGQPFAPISFELVAMHHPQIVDSDGLPMPTVVARPISGAEVQRRDEIGNKDAVGVLKLLSDRGAMKQAQIAKALDWYYRSKPGEQGKPNDKRARTVLQHLKKEGYAAVNLSVWTATPKGQKAANMVESAKAEADE
jgi:Bifunctional DNA primase/polymerase, N-terminal/AAA domain